MNKNVLIAFGGAVLIALVVAMMMSAMLKGGRDKNVAAPAPEIVQVQVMVAAAPLKPGQLLSDKNVKWQSWPENALFPGMIRRTGNQKLADAANGRAARAIGTGEPLTNAAIISDEGSLMSALLTPGKRAVAVKVAANTMAGGFINPGDHVDVLMTYRARVNTSALPVEGDQSSRFQWLVSKNIDSRATETVLQNVRVLGVDQRAAADGENAARVGKTVTLEVDSRQAEILALAENLGSITLALRSLGDDDIVDYSAMPSVTDVRLSRTNREIVSALESHMGAESGYVRIYNGGVVNNLPTR